MPVVLDASDNCIRIDWIAKAGDCDYDHTDPFGLWKIDSWEDKEYWGILQLLSRMAKAGVDVFNLDYMVCEYKKHHHKE